MRVAIFRKKTLLTLAVVAVSVALGCFLLTMEAGLTAAPSVGKTVVIDAGHGGIDGGVVGSTGVKESEINLAVAKALKGMLERSGYRVVMTRSGADGLYESGADSKKLSDMRARRRIIEEASPDLVISVHQNSYPLGSVRGAQAFFRANDEASEKAAMLMQSHLNSEAGVERKAKSGDYYLLTCSEYPSVLVECGFLSNAEEESLLVTAKYQQRIAYAIYSAAHSHLCGEEASHLHEAQ